MIWDSESLSKEERLRRVSLHDTENREFKKNMVKLKEARKNSLKEMEELKLPNETKNEDKLQGLLAKPEEIE